MSAYSKNQMQNLDIRFDEYKTNPNSDLLNIKMMKLLLKCLVFIKVKWYNIVNKLLRVVVM